MKISLLYQVIVAVILGTITGLFFGSACAFLDSIGEIFFMLLQMVVLPYLLFLLIHGLGSLSKDVAFKLFRRSGIFFVLLWAIGFGIAYVLMNLIPIPHLVFVEPSITGRQKEAIDLITYLIPKNIFYDLSHNIVPAVTVCGLISGLAVMSIEKKDILLNGLSQINASIEKILEWLAKISPLAIFSHIAATTGTVHFGKLLKVEICIAIYVFGTLFLTFWVLPSLLSSLTDLTYKEIMLEFRNVCLIPFATTMPSLALPFLYQSLQKLAERCKIASASFSNTSQTVLPLAFAFGQIGNFFVLFFIIFLSFYTHHPLTSIQEYFLMILMLPISFGTVFSSINSVIFLIDKFDFPDEAFHVFLTTSSLTLNFQVLLSVASILTLVILCLFAYYGLIKIKWKKLTWTLLPACVVLWAVITIAKPFVKFQDNFTYLYENLRVDEILKDLPPTKIYQVGEPIPPSSEASLNPLERILKTGELRVGYFPIDVPFSYFNRLNELSGYDVCFAYQLAKDLGCNLIFVPIDLERIGEQLAKAEYDIAMSALVMTEARLAQMDFVKPNFEENNVLIVPLAKKDQFLNMNKVVATGGLKIGGLGAYYETLIRYFPKAQPIEVKNLNDLIEGKVDAIFWSYLSAFVWCLSHPEFTIIDYQGLLGKHFFSYAIAENSSDWLHFLQNWLILKAEQGLPKKMYDYWILGQLQERPRWSIIEDVLHWTRD